jgi:hypothetical protein
VKDGSRSHSLQQRCLRCFVEGITLRLQDDHTFTISFDLTKRIIPWQLSEQAAQKRKKEEEETFTFTFSQKKGEGPQQLPQTPTLPVSFSSTFSLPFLLPEEGQEERYEAEVPYTFTLEVTFSQGTQKAKIKIARISFEIGREKGGPQSHFGYSKGDDEGAHAVLKGRSGQSRGEPDGDDSTHGRQGAPRGEI